MNQTAQRIFTESRSLGWVMEPLAREILKSYSLPVSRFQWARTGDQAVAAAESIGYPVVMKIVSPDVIHKSEVGGVMVGLNSREKLLNAFSVMEKISGFDGVLIDEMVSGIELIVGSSHDNQFGPVIMVGIGGTSVEIYRDVALRLAPLSEKTVLKAMDSLTGKKLLAGYRGRDPVNLPGIARLVARFSRAVMDMSEDIESIDLNPVMCGSRRAIIADARIILRH